MAALCKTPAPDGTFFYEQAARQASYGQLYLPGEEVARLGATHGGELGQLLAGQGFYVVFAPDLCSSEVPEVQGKRIAERKGPDLSALYQGWFL